MSEYETEMLQAVQKVLGLLELLAEDKIAQRDAKLRTALRDIVGGNRAKQRATILMDGTRLQKEIVSEASFDQSDLSKLVGKLYDAKLLVGDKKYPKLGFPVPSNFWESDSNAK